MSTTAIDVRTREEITLAALDYVEGWFDGNAARMERALHPDLAKRTPGQDDVGAGTIETLSAADMIGWTADGLGSRQDPGERRIEIDVHDAYGGIASVTCRCALYVDHLQLAETADGWKIVNVLWRRVS